MGHRPEGVGSDGTRLPRTLGPGRKCHGCGVRERCWKMWGKKYKLARQKLGVGMINGEKGQEDVELKRSLVEEGALMEEGAKLVRGQWFLGSKGQTARKKWRMGRERERGGELENEKWRETEGREDGRKDEDSRDPN